MEMKKKVSQGPGIVQSKGMDGHRAWWRLLLPLLLFVGGVGARPALATEPPLQPPAKVLWIGSYHQGMPWEDRLFAGIRETFQAAGRPVDLRVEHLDSARFQDDVLFRQLWKTFSHKFNDVAFDLIIGSDGAALGFLHQYRKLLFPGTPLVLAGVDPAEVDLVGELAPAAGVTKTMDALGTLKAALTLHPDAERVFVVHDHTPSGKAMGRAVRRQAAEGGLDDLRFQFPGEVTIEELQARLAALPEDSLALFTRFYRDYQAWDEPSQYFGAREGLAAVVGASSAPVYGLFEEALGSGIVGGSLVDGYRQGEAAAQLALRILAGEDPDALPMTRAGTTRFMFDHKVMQRFGIDREALPEGSLVINAPPPEPGVDPGLVLTIAAAVAVEGLIILLLLNNIFGRRRAERALVAERDSLEARVERRTQALNDANLALQAEASARRELEVDIRSFGEKYQNLFSTTLVGLYRTDLDGEGLTECNPAAAELFGFATPQEAMENYRPKAAFAESGVWEGIMEALGEEGRADGMELVMARDGKRKTYVAVSVAFHPLEGVLDWTVVDITRRKEAEEAVVAAKQAAEAAEQAKNAFLASLSHDIRTPLNALIGVADLLGETRLTKEQQGYLEVFQRNEEAMISLIHDYDLLDLSRVTAGKVGLAEVEFELAGLIFGVVRIFDVEARAKEGGGLVLNYHVDERLPDTLRGDPARIRQVLVKLLGNAVKFTEAGEVSLAADLEGEGEEGLLVRFTVSDTGLGVPEEDREAIFKPFGLGAGEAAAKYGGAGLGLTICQRLAGLMGGEIIVEDAPGGGAMFQFTALLQRGSVAVPTSSKKVKTKKPAIPWDRPLSILVAEDSEDNRLMIQAFTKKTPHKMVFANNGQIAVEAFKGGDFDMVFMDIQMPKMDGLTTTRAMRKWERENRKTPTPIIALSAFAFDEDRLKSLDAGCDDHLTKPIGKRRFLEAVKRFELIGDQA